MKMFFRKIGKNAEYPRKRRDRADPSSALEPYRFILRRWPLETVEGLKAVLVKFYCPYCPVTSNLSNFIIFRFLDMTCHIATGFSLVQVSTPFTGSKFPYAQQEVHKNEDVEKHGAISAILPNGRSFSWNLAR